MFETVNELAVETQNSIKIVAGVIATIVILGALGRGSGLSRIIIIALTGGIALWLIAFGGVAWLAEQITSSLNG